MDGSKDQTVSKSDLKAAQKRLEGDHIQVLGLKFSGDGKSRNPRFTRLGRELAGHFSELVINSGPPHSSFTAAPHSVLAADFDGEKHLAAHEAFRRVIRYLDHRLKDNPTGPDYPIDPPDCDPAMFSSCKDYKKL
ncbi:MAG: hypothetical protein ACRD8O_18930 [Bryobacteraceae bacterium]